MTKAKVDTAPRVEVVSEAELRFRYGRLLFNRVSVVGDGYAAVVFRKRTPVSCATVDTTGYIYNVYTRPEYRGLGYASLALSRLQELCTGEALSLTCHVLLESFYLRHRFVRVDRKDEVLAMRWTNPRVKSYPPAHAQS